MLPSRRLHTAFPQGQPERATGRAEGFSLIEVVIALGIGTFAMVAIFGLLPVGLQSFRSAMDTTAAAQIIQSQIADAQLAKFEDLVSAGPKAYYYEEGGSLYDNTGAPILLNSAAHKYTAVVSVVRDTDNLKYLARLIINITDVTKPGVQKTYATHLAKLDNDPPAPGP